jgi:hypothetical protein
MPGKIKIHQE